jgi:hypothetical protein
MESDKMKYQIFLDDERNPSDVFWANEYMLNKYRDESWIICRNKMQFISAIFDHNKIVPSFISFDHDLGDNEPTGYDILKWMIEMDMDNVITIPEDFDFFVHSKNPIGERNIKSYLSNYIRTK